MKIISAEKGPVSPAAENDFNSAPIFDSLRVGTTGVFFPSGLRTTYVPYDSFDRTYVKVHDTKARMCCATAGFEYYRIVFMNGDKCLADYMSENKEAMQAALNRIRTVAPGITVGAN